MSLHPRIPDPAAWGIVDGYHDNRGDWVAARPEVVRQVLEAMGADAETPPPAPVRCIRPGSDAGVEAPSEVVTEAGAVLPAVRALPADLPLGYHTLRRLADGAETRLIVTPGRCHLPEELRAWGWAVQLYSVRSRRSWGIGDLRDLRELARWSRRDLGAGALLLNPLHASLPTPPQEASPYFPSSRRYRNPLYIRIEDVPGADRSDPELRRLAAAGRRLNRERAIDRDRVLDLKLNALEGIFAGFAGSPRFDRYRAREGSGLEDYAAFCAIAERRRSPWQAWPAAVRRPQAPAVGRHRRSRRARFHQWLQWLLDLQLEAAGREIGLISDLAIGCRADGADAWQWQGQFAGGISVGAPPDPFNTAGQDWGLPPFDPWRLRAAAYEPFIQTLRAAFRHGAGLRLDHAMGLFRLFWIPAGTGPSEGVYVRYPHSDLLDILALESVRAGGYVVGEDLGTVENRVRAELAERRVLAYRLLWFEDRHPRDYPAASTAALTTHDLPTLAGVWEGADSHEQVRARLAAQAGTATGATLQEVSEAAHRALAQSPSRLLTATLEDALGVAERTNKPGTTTEWPNWSLALPADLEQIRRDPRPARLARILSRP